MSNLTNNQKDIIECNDNITVRANAGTGKTYTLVKKIQYELKLNNTWKKFAAITFTCKAANEIRSRINKIDNDDFIGTNNSFVISEIIEPFAGDVFSELKNCKFSVDYNVKRSTYDECLEVFLKDKIICSINDGRSGNFVFELGLYILNNSDACRKYLTSRYYRIYIDEYQDCDCWMHMLFLYLCDVLNISLFVVGDDKQSIYQWRGAYPKCFLSFFENSKFKNFTLSDNFRSNKIIQNYSYLLQDETIKYYSKSNNNKEIEWFKSTKSEWANIAYSLLNKKYTTALLARKNASAESFGDELTTQGMEFVYIPTTPISIINNSSSWLLDSIAKYWYVTNYSEFDLMEEIPNFDYNNKEAVNSVCSLLHKTNSSIVSSNGKDFSENMTQLADKLNIELTNHDINPLWDTVTNNKYEKAYKMDDYMSISTTLHSSKGLEFEQVIIFSNDFYDSTKGDIDLFLHYVAVTRAKQHVVIVTLSDYEYGQSKMLIDKINSLYKKYGISCSDVISII